VALRSIVHVVIKIEVEASVDNRTSVLRRACIMGLGEFFTNLLNNFVCTIFNARVIKRANKVTQIFFNVSVLVLSFSLL
jgi:hypothetical protein